MGLDLQKQNCEPDVASVLVFLEMVGGMALPSISLPSIAEDTLAGRKPTFSC